MQEQSVGSLAFRGIQGGHDVVHTDDVKSYFPSRSLRWQVKGMQEQSLGSLALHKSVNLFFELVIINDELTDLRGNRLLQNDFINTFCEISSLRWQVRGMQEQSLGSLALLWEGLPSLDIPPEIILVFFFSFITLNAQSL